MQQKNSLKAPILVMGVVLILLALAWFPTQQTPMQQRPYVDLYVQYDTGNSQLEQLATDIRYRMSTHHSYRLLNERVPLYDDLIIHRVRVELSEENGALHLRARVDEQTIEVNGPQNAASSLSSKLFSLINEALAQP
ncbi:MAG: hypothetical protein JJU03_13255 [Idiomarina sp.]|nr:hypothetical protein [Idiomarina sp.]